MSTYRRGALGLIAAATTVLALAGCAGEQTSVQACKVVTEHLHEISTSATEALLNAHEDPEISLDALQKLETQLVKLENRITDAETKEKVSQTVNSYVKFLGNFEEVANAIAQESTPGNLDEYDRVTDEVKNAFQNLGEFCSEVTEQPNS